MFCCKKRKSTAETVGIMLLAAVAIAAVSFAAYKMYKKCKCGCKKGMGIFPDLGICFEDGELDCDFGCRIPDTDNDVRSDENAVVNSENRTINTPNPLTDEPSR